MKMQICIATGIQKSGTAGRGRQLLVRRNEFPHAGNPHFALLR